MNKKERETSYRVFFMVGIFLLGFGTILVLTISPAFITFLGVGGAFTILGLANRDKWMKAWK